MRPGGRPEPVRLRPLVVSDLRVTAGRRGHGAAAIFAVVSVLALWCGAPWFQGYRWSHEDRSDPREVVAVPETASETREGAFEGHEKAAEDAPAAWPPPAPDTDAR